jgi:hypothetical protein
MVRFQKPFDFRTGFEEWKQGSDKPDTNLSNRTQICPLFRCFHYWGKVFKWSFIVSIFFFQNWATYLKARLNCSIPGDFPFFFNEIQDVYKAPYDDTTFHTVFSTNSNGLKGSAICSFKLEDMETVFDGKFKEQATRYSEFSIHVHIQHVVPSI